MKDLKVEVFKGYVVVQNLKKYWIKLCNIKNVNFLLKAIFKYCQKLNEKLINFVYLMAGIKFYWTVI